MFDLQAIQEQGFQLLQSSGYPCFLRISKGDDSLWVTDLPRRTEILADIEKSLADLGLCCRIEPSSRLWHLDLDDAHYTSLAATLPTIPPAFPSDDSLHEAYALCRLLLAHPVPLTDQPRSPARAILKWMAYPERCPFPASLPQLCATLLRQRMPLPHLGGQLLAAWLMQKGEIA